MAKKKIPKTATKKSSVILKKIKTHKRIVLGSAIVFSVLVWLFWKLPLPNDLSKNAPVSTKILDRNGKLIYEIYADKRRTPVKLKDLPSYVWQTTVSIEDKDFYKHHGFSITGIARAFYQTIFQKNIQGGSTLTQQLVKLSLLSPERTVKRKIREFVLSTLVEMRYSKDEILELYLNEIPYGGTSYGIEAASELYFDKQAKDLTLGEASLLAGLPAAPSKYSPFGSAPQLSKERQNDVLRRMTEDKYISQDEAEKAKKEELNFANIEAPTAPHFALWVKQILADKYGDAVVERGGLRVNTTLDLDLQEFAQKTVFDEVEKLKKQKVGNGATVVVRPASGEILAMVGSKDYFAKDTDGKVNIVFANRQPGSSIKPLNYALALKNKKITPATAFADVPTCFSVRDQDIYCPVNYDSKFHGAVQARFALGNSFNIPAVDVLALNGVAQFVDFARSFGIESFSKASDYGLSLTLGGGEVRPIDLLKAYSVLANQGIKQDFIAITKVEDWTGKLLEETKVEDLTGDRVITPDVTFLISHILYDNNARSAAFGEQSYLNVPGHSEVSVKTGTTNDRRDNWTVGYSEQIAAVTWVGNNDNSPMSGAVSGISGASPIWNRIMKKALDVSEKGGYNKSDDGHAWPKQPKDVVGATVCATTGLIPPGPPENPGCPIRFEYFLVGTVPTKVDGERKDIPIDKTKNEIARPDTKPEDVEIKNHPIFYDPLGTIYCMDCTIPTQSITIRYPL